MDDADNPITQIDLNRHKLPVETEYTYDVKNTISTIIIYRSF